MNTVVKLKEGKEGRNKEKEGRKKGRREGRDEGEKGGKEEWEKDERQGGKKEERKGGRKGRKKEGREVRRKERRNERKDRWMDEKLDEQMSEIRNITNSRHWKQWMERNEWNERNEWKGMNGMKGMKGMNTSPLQNMEYHQQPKEVLLPFLTQLTWHAGQLCVILVQLAHSPFLHNWLLLSALFDLLLEADHPKMTIKHHIMTEYILIQQIKSSGRSRGWL